MFQVLLAEGIILGIALIVVSYVSSAILQSSGLYSISLPDVCQTWNDNYIMESTLLLTGILISFFFEVLGLTKQFVQTYTLTRKV
jgi:hypothetical protein